MRIWLLLIALCLSKPAFACRSIAEAQQLALINNSFLLVYFSDVNSREAKNGKGIFWLDQKDAALFNQFVEFTAYLDLNRKDFKQYEVTGPTVLILDGNGKEIYRYTDQSEPTGMKAALQNFVLPKYFLMNDLNNFHEKKTFNSAARIAQLYLDFSLKVDFEFRKNLYGISALYLDEAEKLLKKEVNMREKSQRLSLLRLFHLAYGKKYAGLTASLQNQETTFLSDTNRGLYYFLKYVSAKGMHENIETILLESNKFEGFDALTQKAERILSETVAVN